MSRGAALSGALLVTLASPATWPLALAVFLLRGGLLVVALPILVLPTPVGLGNLLAPTLTAFVFGGISLQLVVMVGTIVLAAPAMAGVPSAGEPDVVRVVQLLPGVVARNDYNTGLNVRGGEADQNLVLLDGFPIYNPFHLGGLSSTFMDKTVGGIELMTAAFPARYGGRLSSVLDVQSAEDARRAREMALFADGRAQRWLGAPGDQCAAAPARFLAGG